MCLIAIAHRTSAAFPLVIAANRDEDYGRPTRDAHFWDDAPEVIGGRDVVHGGSWLAIRHDGRFAAVTNLRGALPRLRSRGALVGDYVTSDTSPRAFAEALVPRAGDYSGFHLLIGEAGGEIVYASHEIVAPLTPGVHAVSNAPAGETWPKVGAASAELRRVLDSVTTAEDVVELMMQFLNTPGGGASVESEVFIRGEQYGTRSSAVIVATLRDIVFAERTYTRQGAAATATRIFRLVRR